MFTEMMSQMMDNSLEWQQVGLDYFAAAFPGESTWYSENKEIGRTVASKYIEFTDATGRERTNEDGPATLVIPAQAGNGGKHADLDDNRSIIQSIMAVRPGRVICLDHRGSNHARKDEDFSFIVDEQIRAIDYINNGKVHLVALCSSGYISATAAAVSDKALSVTVVASPIDFHIDEGYIYDKLEECGSKPTEMALDMFGGIMPGYLQRFNWMQMDPYGFFLGRYMDIAGQVLSDKEEDKQALYDNRKFAEWYFDMQNMSGAANMQIVKDLFIANKLIKGEMLYHDQKIDLINITCPIAMIGGTKDNITPMAQVFALGDYVSSKTKRVYMVEKGHGLFVSRSAQETFKQAARAIDAAIKGN